MMSRTPGERRGSARSADSGVLVARFGPMAWIIIDGITLVGLLSLAACAPRAEDNLARPIPGAGQVAVEQFCITVSPDEQWLTFVEWKLTAEERAQNQTYSGSDTRVASLNLRTGTRTRHSIAGLSRDVLGFTAKDTDWESSAGFRIITERFRPPGWIRGLYYFQRYGRGVYLALDPSQSEIKFVDAPDTTGTCSDCPPGGSVDFRGRTWDLLSNDVSAVMKEGRVRAIYYWGSGHDRVNAILRVTEISDEEKIVDRHQKQGTNIVIAAIRVSPDERNLAYVVHSKKQEFLAGPREELFIRDLQTGDEKLVATHGSMGNLIWSPRGERLYFAAGGIGSDGTVYVVDVESVFRN